MGRTSEKFRKRFYFPGFTQFFLHIIRNCLTCLQLKNFLSRYQTPPLQPLSSLQSFPGDKMQIDSWTIPIASVQICASRNRCFLQISFRSTTYKCECRYSRTGVNGNFLHAWLYSKLNSIGFRNDIHIQINARTYITTRNPDQSCNIKTSKLLDLLKDLMERLNDFWNTGDQWSDWHRYVPLATFIHKPSCYSLIGCSPSAIFHAREPTKPLDLRFSSKALEAVTAESDFVTSL